MSDETCEAWFKQLTKAQRKRDVLYFRRVEKLKLAKRI